MITRPLDLASRLRPEPRNFDALFYVNVGALVFFFSFFGSRFVLAPGLGVDFRMLEMSGAAAGATTTDSVISVRASGQIFADGLLNLPQLRDWLKLEMKTLEAKKVRQPSLLVRASAGVSLAQVADITSAAREAGFGRIVMAAEEPSAEAGQGR